jgi:AraC-like DNA-binding protein
LDFNNPNGFDCAFRSGFHAISLSISNELLNHDAELMGLLSSSGLDVGQPVLRTDQEQKLDQLRQLLLFLCSRTTANSDPDDAMWILSQLEDEVPVQLLAALSELQQAPKDIPLRARQKGLRKAIEFINENAFENPNIPEICAASCLSWRSLDRAFKECFGIGPKRYTLQLRLIRVRQMLKVAPASAKVSDIANAWGFWHMGDFAQKYRTFFGLNPLEQLKISS